jgi:hypothetical protein
MKSLLFVMGLCLSLSVHAEKSNPLAAVPVTDAAGYLTNGSFEVKRFIAKQGQVWAIGILSGTIGAKNVTHGLQLPVTLSEGSAAVAKGKGAAAQVTTMQCEVLNVAFGPGDVTVLGLHLQLAPVAVNITAEDAPADLLCSVIELVGVVGTALDAVVGLLNLLLGALGGLG